MTDIPKRRSGWSTRRTREDIKPSITLDELWNQFFYQLRVKRRSSKTIDFYRVTQRQLNLFRKGYPDFPDDIVAVTITHLRAFIIWLEKRGLGSGGIHAHVRAVKAIFNWAERETLIEHSPALRLERPALSKDAMPAVTPEQVKLLIARAKDYSDQPLRDVALMMLMFDTGLRAAEVCDVKLSGLDTSRGMVHIVGKGNKPRSVPMGVRAFTAVGSYMRRERNPVHQGVDQLFLARTGKPLTTSGLGSRIALLSNEVGIPRHLTTPHAFRRGFAVEYLRQGGDIFSLQQILGHSSLLMTRRYVNYLDEDLKASHLRFSPGDKLSKH